MSYYKVIDGVRYDRSLLELANQLIAGRGDGRISLEDAQQLFNAILDGRGITATENRTIEFISQQYTLTEPAFQWLSEKTGIQENVEVIEEAKVTELIQDVFRLEGIKFIFNEEEFHKQARQFGNNISFVSALTSALGGIFNPIPNQEGRYTVREAVINIFELDPEDNQAIEDKLRQVINLGTHLQLVPYLPEVEAIQDADQRSMYFEVNGLEDLEIVFPMEMEAVPENWIFHWFIYDISYFGWTVVNRKGDEPFYMYGDHS